MRLSSAERAKIFEGRNRMGALVKGRESGLLIGMGGLLKGGESILLFVE